MSWVDAAYSRLEKEFKSKPFPAAAALKTLCKGKTYATGSAYRILSELEKKGRLEKLGRGVYRTATKAAALKPETPAFVERLAVEMRENGVRGQITGFPVLSGFTNLIPRRIIYLIYVPLGAGETATRFFEEKKDKLPLLNPSLGEIHVALNITNGKDIVVVRESNRTYHEEPAVASPEKAIVDLYFEATRKKIPLPLSEAGRVIGDVLTGTKIDVKKLLRASARRGIRREIEAVLFSLRPDLLFRNERPRMTETAKSVVNAARGI